LREHTALSRRPFALLSDDTLEFFKGSLSRNRHFKVDHNGEEEGVVAHAARRAHERDKPISELETPKHRPATLPPSKTPAQRSNVSKPPSVNHRDGLALPTSLQSGVSNPTELWHIEMPHLLFRQ